MIKERESLWTRDFNLLALVSLLMAVSFYFLLPTLPVYVVKSLGADKSQIGYIIGVYTLAAVSIRPLAGYALDSLGRRRVYLYALGLFALIMPVYQLADELALLLIIRLLHGFSWGFVTTGGGTIVADVIPPQRRGEGIGYYGLAMTIAMAVGPIIGLWLTGENNFNRLFISAGILAAAAFMLAGLVNYPEVPPVKRSLSWQAFFEVKVLPLSSLIFFVTVVYGGVVSFITMYGPEVGIKNAGLFFLVYAVMMGLTRPIAGRLFDKKGPTPVMAIGFVALIAGYLLLALWRNPVGFLTSAAVMGIGFGMIWPSLMAMAMNMVSPQRRGVANSTVFSALDLGIGSGSVLLGLLADYTSISTMYLTSAFILIIPVALYFGYISKGYLSILTNLKADH